jgi:hypothetical protein
MSISIIVFAIALTLGSDPEADRDNSAREADRVRESTERVLELAGQYAFYADAKRKQKFDLQPKPVLTYSNPVRGEVYGSVFVWTHAGRPEVVGAIFDYRSENRMDSEFHLLDSRGTVACRDGQPFLNPARPGIEFQPIAAAPVPLATATARSRQMRDLAKEFSVERDHPEQKKEFMRLLPQPIYRYSSREADVVDGAIFVFVEGTDPEAFLLLEARGKEKPVWEFAFARMNIVEFWAHRQDEIVWHVDAIDWDTVFDKHEPYAIVREQPRRGLSRTP